MIKKNRIKYNLNKYTNLFIINDTWSNLTKNDKINNIKKEINNKKLFIKVNNILIFETKKNIILKELLIYNKFYIKRIFLDFGYELNINKFKIYKKNKNVDLISYKPEKKIKLEKNIINEFAIKTYNNINFNYDKFFLPKINNTNINLNSNSILTKKRQLQSNDNNYITLVVHGPGENIQIMSNDYGNLPNEMYINNSPVTPSRTVTLEEEDNYIIILKWNNKLTSLNKIFDNCKQYLISIDLSNLISSSINNIKYLCNECHSVQFANLTNFRPPYVSGLWHMFHNCYALKSIDMTNSNIPSQAYRCPFINSNLISLDLSSWHYSDIREIDFFITYSGSLILIDLSNFDTTHVTRKGYEFTNCYKLKYINLRYYKGIDIFNTIPNIRNIIYCIYNISDLDSSVSLRQKGATNNCSHICFQRPIIVNPNDQNYYYDCPKLEEDQFCNFEHTEILTEMPDGYFLNDTYQKTIDKCYYLCKKCLNYGNDEVHNCSECIYSLLEESNY